MYCLACYIRNATYIIPREQLPALAIAMRASCVGVALLAVCLVVCVLGQVPHQDDIIPAYFAMGFLYQLILSAIHGVYMSLSTLKRSLRRLKLRRRGPYTSLGVVRKTILVLHHGLYFSISTYLYIWLLFMCSLPHKSGIITYMPCVHMLCMYMCPFYLLCIHMHAKQHYDWANILWNFS